MLSPLPARNARAGQARRRSDIAFQRGCISCTSARHDNLLRMAAIAERFPQIALVPAHDVRGFAGLPRL
jgi:hypothetical protein